MRRTLINGLPQSLSTGARVYLRRDFSTYLDRHNRPRFENRAGHRIPPLAEFDVLIRDEDRIQQTVVPAEAIQRWAVGPAVNFCQRIDRLLECFSAPLVDIQGFPGKQRPLIMGILNVTPDSFSDGGLHFSTTKAVAHGLALTDAGADIIDVGGESTRPGAQPVSPNEEQERVLPVIAELVARGITVSVDTRHSATMAAALTAGAGLINDVSGLAFDSDSLTLAAGANVPIVLVHSLGASGHEAPNYVDVVLDVYDLLEARLDRCVNAGIPRTRLILDPGLGFGKCTDDNVALLRELSAFHGLGCPLLLGASRKRFIARRGERPAQRLAGSLAAALRGIDQVVRILRVHDVAETVQARDLWTAMTSPAPYGTPEEQVSLSAKESTESL